MDLFFSTSVMAKAEISVKAEKKTLKQNPSVIQYLLYFRLCYYFRSYYQKQQ